jgi:NADH:ubiquinone oxidoreductase subunit 5 (subunit L)/multisubunit Na+/H+ antiporter MnhA subunit
MVDLYIIDTVVIRFNSTSSIMVLIVLLVSSFIISNSIDYLSIMDSYLFLIYVSVLQLIMITSILSHDLIFIFLNWDLLGLIPYLSINYWSSKVNCGIKAVIMNRLGDLSILYSSSIIFSFISILGYYAFTSINITVLLCSLFIVYSLNNGLSSIIAVSFLLIIFTKSAQIPFVLDHQMQ